MTDKARELERELERIFAVATAASERRARPKNDEVQMDDETRAAFDSVEKSIHGMIEQTLDPAIKYSLPEEGLMDDIRLALSFHPFYVYEAWHMREDISEAAFLAAEKDIRAGRVGKLEALRDQKRKRDFAMPLLEAYQRYMRLLNNLGYLFWIWAHQAKRYNSPAAAKSFLRALSLVNVRRTRATPNFKESDIDDLIGYMMDGAEEMKIAADYFFMSNDWEDFRKTESVKFAAAIKGLADGGKKGGK